MILPLKPSFLELKIATLDYRREYAITIAREDLKPTQWPSLQEDVHGICTSQRNKLKTLDLHSEKGKEYMTILFLQGKIGFGLV